MRVAILALALLASCMEAPEPKALPDLDPHFFRCRVEPVIAARCGFQACHGTATRPYRVYAPARLRLDSRRGGLSEGEHAANLQFALALADPGLLPESLLLLKALDVDAGGMYHGGKTQYGGADVFEDRADPGFVAIEEWLAGVTAPTDCEPTTEVGW